MRPQLWPENVTDPLYIARNLNPRLPIPPELTQMLWDEDPHRALGAVFQLIAIHQQDDAQRTADVERAFRQRLEQAATLPHLVAKPIEETLAPPATRVDPSLMVQLRKEQESRKALAKEVEELRSRPQPQERRWLTPTVGAVVAGLLISVMAALAVFSPDAFDRMAGLLFQRNEDSALVRQLQEQRDRLQADLAGLREEQERLSTQRAQLEAQTKTFNEGSVAADKLAQKVFELEAALTASQQERQELRAALEAAKKGIGAGLEPGTTFADCTGCPEMVVIPTGSFVMGSPEGEEGRIGDEGPQREVSVPKFALATTEVTFDQWQACVDGGGCPSNQTPDDEGWGRGSRPVINVSWEDAQEYISWLNAQVEDSDPYRLPTEAEWEYAARAGTTTPYSFGKTISTDQANFAGNFEGGKTAPVQNYPANSFDLFDMHGNVWEWVEDCWHDNYEGAPTDGSAWLSSQNGNCARRVVRGGSWLYLPQNLRSAYRYRFEPEFRDNFIGFRPARALLTP